MSQNDPELVRAEYADESRFAVRAALWAEVGCGRGELADASRASSAQRSPLFPAVRAIELDGTIELTAAEMREYVANSVAHRHLAERVPDFEGTRRATTSSAVFVATKR